MILSSVTASDQALKKGPHHSAKAEELYRVKFSISGEVVVPAASADDAYRLVHEATTHASIEYSRKRTRDTPFAEVKIRWHFPEDGEGNF
jgi:pyruvate/2-oxoglutarate/acetoin dehydrogenase E1 component